MWNAAARLIINGRDELLLVPEIRGRRRRGAGGIVTPDFRGESQSDERPLRSKRWCDGSRREPATSRPRRLRAPSALFSRDEQQLVPTLLSDGRTALRFRPAAQARQFDNALRELRDLR